MLAGQPPGQPHLEKRGATTELIVDGQPFLMISGELLNSSSSNLDAMKPVWPRLAGMGLNTVVTPLSWELIEPKEGTYDFSLVDGLLAGARESHERIVFLWFGSWKNGTSSYAPVWVKTDTHRFPREVEFGNAVETLSPLGKETEKADAKAFGALMAHLKANGCARSHGADDAGGKRDWGAGRLARPLRCGEQNVFIGSSGGVNCVVEGASRLT